MERYEPISFNPTCGQCQFRAVPSHQQQGVVYLVDPHLRTPYVYQYNLSLQRNLFADTVLETNYVGSSGHGLTSLKDINPMVLSPAVPGTTNRVLDSSCFRCFGQLPEFQNVSNANYNALEASLTRQPKSSKLGTAYFTLAYTYGHNLDNASGFAQRNSQVPAYSPDLFYASGDSDVRQRISFSGGWDLPFDRMWATGPKRLTKGWSVYPIVTWRTGFPFDIPAGLGGGYDPTNPGTSGAGDPVSFPRRGRCANTHARSQAPDHDRSDRLRQRRQRELPDRNRTTPVTGHFIFDPNSFSNVPLENNSYYDGGTPTPVSRSSIRSIIRAIARMAYHATSLRGPQSDNLDITLAKTTAITERVRLEFRVDFSTSESSRVRAADVRRRDGKHQ